jgi:hypothetical protein
VPTSSVRALAAPSHPPAVSPPVRRRAAATARSARVPAHHRHVTRSPVRDRPGPALRLVPDRVVPKPSVPAAPPVAVPSASNGVAPLAIAVVAALFVTTALLMLPAPAATAMSRRRARRRPRL